MHCNQCVPVGNVRHWFIALFFTIHINIFYANYLFCDFIQKPWMKMQTLMSWMLIKLLFFEFDKCICYIQILRIAPFGYYVTIPQRLATTNILLALGIKSPKQINIDKYVICVIHWYTIYRCDMSLQFQSNRNCYRKKWKHMRRKWINVIKYIENITVLF